MQTHYLPPEYGAPDLSPSFLCWDFLHLFLKCYLIPQAAQKGEKCWIRNVGPASQQQKSGWRWTHLCNNRLFFSELLLVPSHSFLVLLVELKVLLLLKRPGQLLRLGLCHRQIQLGRQGVPVSTTKWSFHWRTTKLQCPQGSTHQGFWPWSHSPDYDFLPIQSSEIITDQIQLVPHFYFINLLSFHT